MTVKPSWWDKDYSNLFKQFGELIAKLFDGRIVTALKHDLRYLDPFYFKKKALQEQEEAYLKARHEEYLRLDAIQKEFERNRRTPLEKAQEQTQQAAEKQRLEFGKQYWGDDSGFYRG